MKLSKTELRIIEQMAIGITKPKEIAEAIKKNHSQTYVSLKSLETKGIIKNNHLTEKSFVRLLAQLLINHSKIKDLLADSGIQILLLLNYPLTIREIEDKTNLKKSMIYNKIKEATHFSILRKDKNKYYLNENIWGELTIFLKELKLYEETIDLRIPADAKIYYKNGQEIVYSSNQKQNTCYTAFSAYKGIKLFLPTDYYYLPNKRLSIKEIFTHSLYVVEKTKEYRLLLYTALFYLKYKNSLRTIKHNILDNIKKIIKGEIVNNYPSLKEIKEKAEQYDIEI